jgi:hypothetical protein
MKTLALIALAQVAALGCTPLDDAPTASDEPLADTSSPVTTTGARAVRLDRSLVAAAGDEWDDLDDDGLVDQQEDELANAFRPYLAFDSGEHARQAFEPVTVFQVRPQSYRLQTLVVHIHYVFLFGQDGGYGGSSWCDDSHAGDNDDAWLEATSWNDGVDWTITRVHLSFKGIEWPTNANMQLVESTHPVIYMSGSKHHEYFDTSHDGNDSAYSDYGCNDDVDGRGAQLFADVSSLSLYEGYRNNIGEPESAGSPYFVNRLDAFWPGESIWGGDPFFSVDANSGKASRAPRPLDLGHLTAPAALWTSPVSEESAVPAYCPNGHAMTGVQCTGRYCDNVAMRCDTTARTPTRVWWTGWFSDENTTSATCPGGLVTGVQCSGRYCDNVRLECMSYAGASPYGCTWTGGVSEEQPATYFGKFVAGARCSGDYCDSLSFLVCNL